MDGPAVLISTTRFDNSLLPCAIADRVAGGIDAGGQRRVGNDPAAPNGGNEIILADDTVTIADQKIEQIERLRRNRNEISPAAQFAAVRVQHIVREEVTQAAVLGRDGCPDATLTRRTKMS